ncbi:MAG TPA: GNAT family N-acetyltransferase [Nitrospirota bacterium]|nr:GNAT family N-acetyltransferase [Nitrospirota bacterium]
MTPHPQTRIRTFRAGDIAACAEIVSRSDPWKRLGEQLDFRRILHHRAASSLYVSLIGRTVVGFIIFTPYPVFARGGYLRAIAVSPDARNQGIGRTLLLLAERKTAMFSPHFYLCVSSFNRKAQAFYKRLGYKRIGTIPGLITPHASEYIYWKRLR